MESESTMTHKKPAKPPRNKRRDMIRLDAPTGRTINRLNPRKTRWVRRVKEDSNV